MSSNLLDQLIHAVAQDQSAGRKADEPVIEIQGALRHLTALYERLRSFVDYQEERFIRRLAIRRILFRQLVLERSVGPIGERLLRELIRAAYLENGRYPTRTAQEIDQLLTSYRAALAAVERRYGPPELLRIERRLLGVAAAGIEDLLHPAAADRLLAAQFENEISGYLGRTAADELRTIALRTLWKADGELLAAELLAGSERQLAADFRANPERQAANLLRLIVKAEHRLRDRRIEGLVRRFTLLAPPYLILADLAARESDDLDTFKHDRERLRRTLEDLVHERLATSDQKLQRALVRTTIYILITKILIGLALEIPYDLATIGRIALLPLGVNLLIPPLLMVAAGIGVRTPGRANTELVTDRARRILFGEELPPLPEVQTPERRRSPAAAILFSLFYFATYATSFGGLIWLLTRLHFNLISIAVFLFFLSVVGFFAFRLRTNAHELKMIRERESVVFLVFDFFALPFLRVGRFLSLTVRQFNIFLFVLDFLIEAPLKLILVALEDWFAFLREKREELS